MKAPVPENARDAVVLGEIIGRIIESSYIRAMYSEQFILDRWRRNTFQSMFDHNWEHVWIDEQRQKIMVAWIAHRIER